MIRVEGIVEKCWYLRRLHVTRDTKGDRNWML